MERQHEAYWDSFWDAEHFSYGHMLGFKGLEWVAVVLPLNSTLNSTRLRERVFLGLSRAQDELMVCADPAVLFARRLG